MSIVGLARLVCTRLGHVLTLFRMRSEHLQSCWLDAVEARESQGRADALEQLSLGIYWVLRCRFDGFRYLLDVL